MPTTYSRKKLKDKDGNYIVTVSLADMTFHQDGTTVEEKVSHIESVVGDGSLDTAAANLTDGVNELKEEFNSYLQLSGGNLSGNVVFDNNAGIGAKNTDGNTEWLLYLNSSDKVVVGTNSNELSVHGTYITLHGKTEAAQKVTFHGGTAINNNTPHTGKRVDDSIVELIYVSTQDHVRVGSYNSPAPLILNSSQDILFENKTQRFIDDTKYHSLLNIDKIDDGK